MPATGVVTGFVGDAEDKPFVGRVYFTPTSLLVGDEAVYVADPVKVPLIDGEFEVTLLATDDPDIEPHGWVYEVSFSLDQLVQIDSFYMEVPAGSVQDLSDVLPVPGPDPLPKGRGVPPGGLSGQVLAKASPDDYDTEWVDQTGGGGGGDQGPRGFSAYEVAVQNGFVGTEEAWLTSLIGPQGLQGHGWHVGDGPPDTSTPGFNVGDYYLDQLTGTIYRLMPGN